MNKNKRYASVASIIMGILCFVLAFFSKQGANSSKGASITGYIGGKQVSSGTIGGNSDAVEFFEVLFYAFIIGGVFAIILGIILAIIPASKSQNQSSTNSSIFIKCPICGENNGSNNTYCYKCRTLLNRNNSSNTWFCTNCGKTNQSYVGTCGCGQQRT